MARVINATEETIVLHAHGNYFTFKPGQEKPIRNENLARFIQTEKRGCGLAVLPDLVTTEEEVGDVDVSDAEMKARKAADAEAKKAACAAALREYVNLKREIIKNNQVSLARDLARADYKYGPEHEISDGELEAMRLVAKYDVKGKDAKQEQLDEIETLKKQISSK